MRGPLLVLALLLLPSVASGVTPPGRPHCASSEAGVVLVNVPLATAARAGFAPWCAAIPSGGSVAFVSADPIWRHEPADDATLGHCFRAARSLGHQMAAGDRFEVAFRYVDGHVDVKPQGGEWTDCDFAVDWERSTPGEALLWVTDWNFRSHHLAVHVKAG